MADAATHNPSTQRASKGTKLNESTVPSSRGRHRSGCHALHIQWGWVSDWDENNLRKIRAHRIKSEEVEQGLSNSPILIYEQDVQGELRRDRVRSGCESKEGLPGPAGARGVKP
jgi:hypothetical protein